MSLLLSALKDAEGRKRAQQAPVARSAPEPAPEPAPGPAPGPALAPDAGEIAALLSSAEEDTLLSLEEDVVEPPREPDVYATPASVPASAPVVAAAAAMPPPAATPPPSAFAGLPTPQDILRARAERAVPAQAAQGSSVAAARATRGTSTARSGSGASAPEAGLDAVLKRLVAHLPTQLRQHPLPIAGAAIAFLLLVGWFVLGGSSTGMGDAPPTLGPSLPPATIAAAPTNSSTDTAADTASGPQGADDVALPTLDAPAEAAPTADAPIALAAPVRQPAATPGLAPHSAAPAAPSVPYTGARIKPRLEIAGRPSPLPAAYAALRAGDLALAQRLYTETLAGEPDQPDAHLGLAVLAQGRGDDAAAIRHFRAVLETVPDHPRAWAGLAALVGSGELEPMESKLRGLIAARPAPALHFALGNVLARQGRWAEAQQGFFAASATDPQNADYAFNLAVSLDRIGKGVAASPHYARAAALAEAGAPAQFQPAVARQRLAELQPGTP